MNIFSKSLIVVNALLLGGLAILFFQSSKTLPDKAAYINIGKLYDEFLLRKELDSKLTNVEQKRKSILDSLEIELKVLAGRLNKNGGKDQDMLNNFEMKKEIYENKKQQFDEDNQAITQQYHQEISKQMNAYVKEYGDKMNYDFIYGAEGSGALMYAKDAKEITNDVLQFINNRYKGKTE